jgi:transposase
VQRAQLAEGVELDPVMEREREARLEAIKARLLALVAEGRGAEAVDASVAAMLELERECERLSWRVLRAERYRFGHQSEKLSREELEALARGLGASASEAAAEDPQIPTPTPSEDVDSTAGEAGEQGAQPAAPPAKEKKTRNRKAGGSTVIDPKVERRTTRSTVPESERCCGLCGREKSPMQPVVHEILEFEPAKLVLRIQEREQLSCSSCRKDVVVAAPVTPVTGRRIAPSVLAKLIADKCEMSLPLDRQRHELKRLGADMPEQTIASCWAYALDLLEPVAVATFSETLACKIVGADDSHLRTLLNGPGSARGHLWCFVGTDGTVGGQERVAYGYTETWEAGQIQGWFAAVTGDVQVDGYAGYAAEVETDDGQVTAVPDERRLGCMMHVRSKFHTALLVKDKRAAVPLEMIGRLYDIESDCRKLDLDAEGRGRVRAERSIPILDALDAWVDETHARLLPKSPLRVATTYQKNQRSFVRRCFEDGRYEIDNGRTERRIRTFAVGRRVYLFTGSVRGGERLAIAYTITENCKIRGIDPRVYLEDVLTKLMNGWPVRRLSELTPHRWVPDHAREHRQEQPPAPG